MPVRSLTKELREKAETELNEKPDQTEADLDQIKEWLKKQPHLNVRTDDQWLLSFLRCSKFSIQRTKERLDYFYTMRTLIPELFENRDPFLPEIQEILNRGINVPLSNGSEPAGPLGYMLRWCKADPAKNSFLNIVKVELMIFDILLIENDNFSVAGVAGILDYNKFSFNYLLQLGPSLCKKLVLSWQSAYPIRIKKLYCINVPHFFGVMFGLFKPFFSEKLLSRVDIYETHDFPRFCKEIPQADLPKEYGGGFGSADTIAAQWKKKVESYRDWFVEDAGYCSNESRRPGKPRTCGDVFGIEGSFRKLTVD